MPSPIQSTFLEKREVAEETYEFRFARPADWTFEPGHHLELILPSLLKPDEKGSQRSFSIASIPSDPYLAITTRIRNSGFKQTLLSLRPGDPVDIGGPYGTFLLHEDTGKPAILLAGGIGITPFLSMLRQNEEQPPGHEYTLFYSNRTLSAAAYHDYFLHLANLGSIQYYPTLTDDQPAKWTGRVGRIDDQLLRQSVTDPAGSIWYSAGPPGFVVAMQNLLKKIGVGRDWIKSEDFSGYD